MPGGGSAIDADDPEPTMTLADLLMSSTSASRDPPARALSRALCFGAQIIYLQSICNRGHEAAPVASSEEYTLEPAADLTTICQFSARRYDR